MESHSILSILFKIITFSLTVYYASFPVNLILINLGFSPVTYLSFCGIILVFMGVFETTSESTYTLKESFINFLVNLTVISFGYLIIYLS